MAVVRFDWVAEDDHWQILALIATVVVVSSFVSKAVNPATVDELLESRQLPTDWESAIFEATLFSSNPLSHLNGVALIKAGQSQVCQALCDLLIDFID